MLQSAIINSQQHVGLQKLSALAGMLHSSLGPDKKYKFIQDDTSGESALACSCFRIIENLEPTCAVGQLVYETVQAQQRVYHTGSGCLLFLAGAWSRAALDCLQRGISVTHIISAMSEGMDICIDVCRKSSISIQDLPVTLSEGCSAAPGVCITPHVSCDLQETTKVNRKTLNVSGQRKVKLSRHFCETKSEIVSQARQPRPPGLPDIPHIAETLSHGCDKAMKLVVEAIQLQSDDNQQDGCHPVFDINKMVTCVLPGLPEQHACVVQGCIVLLSDEQASVAHHLKAQHLRVALINGDLSHTYRHLGFKTPAGVQSVSDQLNLARLSKGDEWLDKVGKLLLHLEVNLILTTGHACESLIQHCCKHRILVVEKVNSSILRTFASSTGVVPVTYATQLSKHCVGTGVQVAIWRDLSSFERKSSTAVRISTDGNVGLVTAILTSCVQGKLQALEDQFWACAYRLHHALRDGALLPGAGRTEMLCIHHLQDHREKDTGSVQHSGTGTAADLYRSVVFRLMANGLMDYITTVMVNTGAFSKVKARTIVGQHLQNFNGDRGIAAKFPQLVLEGDKDAPAAASAMKPDEAPAVKIYDNLSVKLEAWRKALDLVFLVLQTDAEVITGVGQKNEDNLMLL
ncbi:chaperonin-containing T-complex member BBS12 [Odontesthes bonariensis]|uniref:chaperonin-containing T-complex member BBS12 n=1 Tax=Odontesthes bonariensis TaxID=219752 RepID=UPI003F5827D0